MNDLNAVAQLLLALAAVVASIIGVRLSRRVAIYDFHQSAIDILQDLTTGEVALARHLIGTLMYGDDDSALDLRRADVIRAYYTLLWCIERVARGYTAINIVRSDQLSESFSKSVAWHANEIVTNLALVHHAMQIEDAEAWASLADAVRLLSDKPQLRIALIDSNESIRLINQRRLTEKVPTLR